MARFQYIKQYNLGRLIKQETHTDRQVGLALIDERIRNVTKTEEYRDKLTKRVTELNMSGTLNLLFQKSISYEGGEPYLTILTARFKYPEASIAVEVMLEMLDISDIVTWED